MIKSEEKLIQGSWFLEGGKLKEDEICQRIRILVGQHLRKLGHDRSGWDVLFVDPADNRLWELTYPQSEVHGGGPPVLTWITKEQAKAKYVWSTS
jgi:Immunity protein 27